MRMSQFLLRMSQFLLRMSQFLLRMSQCLLRIFYKLPLKLLSIKIYLLNISVKMWNLPFLANFYYSVSSVVPSFLPFFIHLLKTGMRQVCCAPRICEWIEGSYTSVALLYYVQSLLRFPCKFEHHWKHPGLNRMFVVLTGRTPRNSGHWAEGGSTSVEVIFYFEGCRVVFLWVFPLTPFVHLEIRVYKSGS
jgi:hypothetical protein